MKALRYIKLFSLLTLIFIYLVILAGSIVRTTGSGMGCPDWPKCFGQWVPPTELAQLPEDYEQTFLNQRKEKLDKYISLLEALGADDLAQKMRADDSILRAEPFNAMGTWIEYINRVVGFMSGNLMLILFIFTLVLIKKRPRLALMAFIALVAISFQAWLGAVVVATNLTPWVITVHMMVAFLIIALLISIYNNLKGETMRWRMYRPLMLLSLCVTLLQVIIGTQVRQEVDHIKHLGIDRMDWIAQLGEQFEIHRSFSIVLVLINAYLVFVHWNAGREWRILAGILLLELVVGISLSYLGMPQVAQPAHLMLATVLFGWQWHIYSDRRVIPSALTAQ
jgi:cytochrome c oxidase assembly protein subunit 15